MNIFDILLISVGLSMDNMAVAIASSCGNKKDSAGKKYKVALTFCLTGVVCLLLGWYGGVHLEKYIQAWDHWVSFFVLLYIGGKMVLNFIKGEESPNASCDFSKIKTLFIMALATNIDVFAIGLTLSFYKVSLAFVLFCLSVCIILFTLLGFSMGKKMGLVFGKRAELFGGIILIVIGLKILIQGVLSA